MFLLLTRYRRKGENVNNFAINDGSITDEVKGIEGKEKRLVSRIFSISDIVFQRYFPPGR